VDAYTLALAAVVPTSGSIADRLGRRRAGRYPVGLALVSAGLGLGLLVQATSSWVALVPLLLVGGLGTGLFSPAVSAVALGSAPPEQSGLAAGVNDTFRQAGVAVGVALYGALIPGAAALGNGSAEAFVNGMHKALIVGAVLAGIGAIASARLIPIRRAAATVEAQPVRAEISEAAA
jgi:MFS family permease